MREVILNEHDAFIAIQGEANSTAVVIDIGSLLDEFPRGVPTLLYKRADGDVYPLNFYVEGSLLKAVLTKADTSIVGKVQFELQWKQAPNVIVKTMVYNGYINPSVGAEEVPEDIVVYLLEEIQKQMGDLKQLKTEVKDNLVAAINELAEHGGGGSSQIDIDGYRTEDGAEVVITNKDGEKKTIPLYDGLSKEERQNILEAERKRASEEIERITAEHAREHSEASRELREMNRCKNEHDRDHAEKVRECRFEKLNIGAQRVEGGLKISITNTNGVTKDYYVYDGQGGSGGDVEWADIKNKPDYFPPTGHRHLQEDIVDLDSSFNAKVDKTTKVNGKPLSGDINLGAADVGAASTTAFNYLATRVEQMDDKIPTKVSELENDAHYLTEANIPTKVSQLENDAGYITNTGIPAWARQPEKPTYTATEVGALPKDQAATKSEVATVLFKIPKKTSQLTNDSGFITSETDPTVPAWAKAAQKPSYTAAEVGALPAETQLADLPQDAAHQTVSQVEKNAWAAAALESHSHANKDILDQITTMPITQRALDSEAEMRRISDVSLQSQINDLKTASVVADIVETYDDLISYSTMLLTENDIIKVLSDRTHANGKVYYRWYDGRWNYMSKEPQSDVTDTYTKTEIDGFLSLKADVDDVPTDAQKAYWNAKQEAFTNANILNQITELPAPTSELLSEIADRMAADAELQAQIDAILPSAAAIVDVVETYALLLAHSTSSLKKDDIIKVLRDETRGGAKVYYRWSGSAWGYVITEPDAGVDTYTKMEIDTLLREKADRTHIHQMTEVNGLVSALANKSDINHTHDDTYYSKEETDLALAQKADLMDVAELSLSFNEHKGDEYIHVSAADRARWDACSIPVQPEEPSDDSNVWIQTEDGASMPADPSVRWDIVQNLSETQKQRARANLGLEDIISLYENYINALEERISILESKIN